MIGLACKITLIFLQYFAVRYLAPVLILKKATFATRYLGKMISNLLL